MRWISWSDREMERLCDAHWMLERGKEILELLRNNKVVLGDEAYLYSGNPDRFDRIISMSAWIEFPDASVAGSKWVSSRAANLELGLPRGGAVSVLNSGETGFPLIAYEGSGISLARTAMVSCLAVQKLFDNGPDSMSFIGAGRVHDWQAAYVNQLWPETELFVFDLDRRRAEDFAEKHNGKVLNNWKDGLYCEVFSLATSGSTAVGWLPWRLEFTPLLAKVWLHTSLRDMQPRLEEKFPLVVVDDHVMATTQGTTHSFAWRENWVKKEISLLDLVVGGYEVEESDYPVLVSPMGLAIWDVGIGYRLFEKEFMNEMEKGIHAVFSS